jgi:hypothetical protein
MIVNLIDYLRGRIQLLIWLSCIGIAGVVIWSLTVDTHHAHTWVEKAIPAFWGLFGLCSCVIIIFFARWFGRSGIKVREDYYDN